MRNDTPVAPQGIRVLPLPNALIQYETAEGQTIRVSARGFRNPWSMAFVSDDTILVTERGGQIRAVRNGVVDPQPVAGAPDVRAQGLSGMGLALHPDFDRNRSVYISYTLLEMELALGYPRCRLVEGARVLVLLEQPTVGQFVFAGSTLTLTPTIWCRWRCSRTFPFRVRGWDSVS